jgi:hypothetical protein
MRQSIDSTPPISSSLTTRWTMAAVALALVFFFIKEPDALRHFAVSFVVAVVGLYVFGWVLQRRRR